MGAFKKHNLEVTLETEIDVEAETVVREVIEAVRNRLSSRSEFKGVNTLNVYHARSEFGKFTEFLSD